MTAFTDLSSIVNRVTGGTSGTPEHIWFGKVPSFQNAVAPTLVAGAWQSLLGWMGNPAGVDVFTTPSTTVPSSGANPTRTLNGSLQQANPGGARQKWLLGFEAYGTVAGTLMLYDRLLHVSGFSGTVITAQTVGGTNTVSRYNTLATCTSNSIWLEIYQIVGNTKVNVTCSYQNQANSASSVTMNATFGNNGFQEAGALIPLPFASGDTGLLGVNSVTLSATTGGAGNFGVTVIRPLAMVPVTNAGVGTIRDMISGIPQLPEIKTDACLCMAWFPNSTTAPSIVGAIHSVEN